MVRGVQAEKEVLMLHIRIEEIAPQQVLIDRSLLQILVEKVRERETVQVVEVINDLPIEGLMKSAEQGGALDFLNDKREEVYTVEDLKVRYR